MRERRDREPAVGEEPLLARALLGDVQDVPARPHRRVLAGRLRGGRRHVLELEGHDVDVAREGANRVEVVERRR